MRLAFVHDWLTGLRGGERVLDVLVRAYPDADIHTLIHRPGTTTEAIDRRVVAESWLGRIPGVGQHYRRWLPLFPAAARSLEVSGYDAVVSVHHAVAKSATIRAGTPHLCYCLTPMRYVWDQADAYLGRGLKRAAAAPIAAMLRAHDVRTSREPPVTRFAAISTCVQDRIARHYGRPSRVVAPPVDTKSFAPVESPRADRYLLVSGFVPYKRDALAIEAFAASGRPLLVVGDGPARARIAAGAPSNIEFAGRVSDRELAELYAHCRALVFPQEEDFGLIAVEAQAAGRPVVAFGRGGARDTVRPLGEHDEPTGVTFDEPDAASLNAGLDRFEAAEASFDLGAARRNAERFSEERFLREFAAELERTLGT